MWQQWMNGILGIVVIIMPFLGMDSQTSTVAFTVVGLAIAALGFWGTAEHASRHAHHRMSHA